MILHSLTIEGFGPFGGKETLDFDSLIDDGLFLITGPTGAGKTTILDAVCFALYGFVPGVRGKAKQYRSQFAHTSTPTTVTIEFSVRGKRIRIQRSPAYERPKKRGTGTTTTSAQVAYWEYVGGEWIGKSRRMDEVGSFVAQAIGLNAEQFTRVILLPQGEFAAFLRAESNEREAIVEKLFGMERFGRIEDYVRALQTSANQRSDAIATRRTHAIQHLLQTVLVTPPAGLARPTLATVTAAGALAFEAVTERAGVEEVRAEVARNRDRDATNDLNAIVARCEDASQLLAHRTLVESFDEHELQDATERVRILEDVARLQAPFDEFQRAHNNFENAAQALSALPDFPEPETYLEHVQTLQAACQRAREAWDVLDSVTQERQTLVTVRKGVDEERASLVEQSERLAHQDLPDLVTLRNMLSERRHILDDARTQRNRVYELAADLRKAQKALKIHQGALEEADLHINTAKTRYEQIRAIRLHGIAAELATELTPGNPCPVCGSREHPQLAQPAEGGVAKAQEEQAFEVYQSATEDVSKQQTQVATHQARVDALSESASALPQVDEVEEVLAQAEQRHTDAEQACVDAETTVETHTRETARIQKLLEANKQRAREAEVQAATLDERDRNARAHTVIDPVLFARAHLTEVTGSQQLTSVIARLDTLTRQVKQVITAREARARAQAELTARREVWEKALTTSALTNDKQFQHLRTVSIDTARARLTQLSELQARITANTTSDWYARAVADDTPLEELEQKRRAARARKEQTENDLNDVLKQHFHLHEHRDQVVGERDRLISDESDDEGELEKNLRIVELAQIVTATSNANIPRVTLKSFALGHMFADVTVAASERLTRMTGGRYTLLHQFERSEREKRGGLVIRVRDDYTSEVRDTRSLSGGETFMASLALALGLADTVTAYAGGIELDSLFIDEGFGSLDPDSLNAVMSVLDELRAGGRTVGVISHVESMLTTIPHKLRVTSSATGSTVSAEIPR